MAKKGKTETFGSKVKTFEGSGVEGQKGAEDASSEDTSEGGGKIMRIAVTPELLRGFLESLKPELRAVARQTLDELDGVATPAAETETAADLPEAKPAFDKASAEYNVQMRHGRPQRIWFREGKEIGAEDVD